MENTYVEVSFLKKVPGLGLELNLKRDLGTGIFLWILRKF